MMQNDLPVSPSDAAKSLLSALPAKRMRDVVERRFGLKGGSRATLESIGATYKITRERVRQIERDAMTRLRRHEHPALAHIAAVVEAALHDHGEVMASHHLFSYVAPKRLHPHLHFLLQVSPRFSYLPESDAFHPRWATSAAVGRDAENIMTETADRLAKIGKTVREPELRAMLTDAAGAVGEGRGALSPKSQDAYLAFAKNILKNPYGEYGLASWPMVDPRGIKDKAYTALAMAGKPLHFREVASAIDSAGWPGRKKAHPQTVHNELIKDKRFVLVGRGMYALDTWGYEPGTVADVLMSVLKESQKPLSRENLITLAGERRMVKPQTILLNLHDKTRFRRTDDGKYTLV